MPCRIKNSLSCPLTASSILMLAAAAAIGAALTAQYGFGLHPCPLCIYQRIPYFIAFLLGLAAILPARRGKPKAAALLIALTAPVFLTGAAIAFYHHGVEQHWWSSFIEGCKVTLDAPDAQSLLDQIMAAGPARCDEIPWKDPVFGQSMAAWNIVASGALAVLSLLSAILIARRANGF